LVGDIEFPPNKEEMGDKYFFPDRIKVIIKYLYYLDLQKDDYMIFRNILIYLLTCTIPLVRVFATDISPQNIEGPSLLRTILNDSTKTGLATGLVVGSFLSGAVTAEIVGLQTHLTHHNAQELLKLFKPGLFPAKYRLTTYAVLVGTSALLGSIPGAIISICTYQLKKA